MTHRISRNLALRLPLASLALTIVGEANAQYVVSSLQPSAYFGSEVIGASGTMQVGDAGTASGGSGLHAITWTGTAASAVDLNPTGFSTTRAYGTNGTVQVGFGSGTATSSQTHALLWSGTASSYIDLNPSGFTDSTGRGATATQQFGYGTAANGQTHALLWGGTAASAQDLNPTGYTSSFIFAGDGTNLGGQATGTATGGNGHAVLWTGAGHTLVDLNPTGGVNSAVATILDSRQAGFSISSTNGPKRAYLWSGTAASGLDITPTAFAAGSVDKIGSLGMVGWVSSDNAGTNRRAGFWSSNGSTFIDLSASITGFGTLTSSEATGFGVDGSIYGYAVTNNGASFAVRWTPVPEPASLLPIVAGVTVALGSRKRRRSRMG